MNTFCPGLRTTIGLLALVAPLLASCGGGIDDADNGAGVRVVGTLLADDGSVMPSDPQAEPADPAARTRRQQYATVQQAAMLADALGRAVTRLTVDCCTVDGREMALLKAHALQAAGDLPATALVLVDGADTRQAAAVANWLEDAGMTHVFLVTR